MNIAITGAEGFIGHHLSGYLALGHSVFAIDDKNGGVDLADAEKVKTYFDEFKKGRDIDVIIHLAFNLASPKDAGNVEALRKNIKIAENVAYIAMLFKPKKIINFSSMSVYPDKDGVYNESSVVDPSENSDSLYGLSKLYTENILDNALKGKDIVITHLRVAQVYGEGMRQDRIMPVMIQELKKNNTITVFGNGERTSNFIKVDKLVRLVDVFIKRDLPGVCNVGEENISYLELAKKLIGEYGDERSRIVQDPKGSRSKFRLDTGKLNGILKKEGQLV